MARNPPTVFPPPEAAAARTGFLDPSRIPALELVHAAVDHFQAGGDAARRCHRHRVYHLVVVTAGTGSFLVDDAVIPVTQPTLFCLSPEQPHCFARRAGDDTIYSEITFQPRAQGPAPDWSALISALVGESVHIPSVGPVRADVAAELRALIARMVHPTWAGHPHLGVLVQGFLCEALFAVWRCVVADAAAAPAVDPLERARRWMEGHLDRSVMLDEFAAVAELSPKHFGRAFKQRFGVTPVRYHQQACLERAAMLLRTTDHPIKRIADWCGFEDVAYFTRRFGRHHGQTPAAYRRQQVQVA